jgi:integrase
MAIHLVTSTTTPSPMQRLCEDYLAHCQARGLSPRTVTNSYGYALYDVFLPWCAQNGIERVADLDGRAVDRFTSSLLQRERHGRPISKHTVHSYVRPVRQMLTWASRVGEDVRAKPQLPRCSKPMRAVLSREEIDRMERAVPNERDKLIIRVLGDCGLRLNELAHLTPADVVRSSGRQAFLRVLGKGSRVRDVPVPPLLLRRLERLIDARPDDRSGDRIFLTLRRGPSGEFDPLLSTGVHQVVTDAGLRARLPQRVHAHLLRHSWMTEMLRQGMNPFQLSIIAGASLPVIMEHYTHLTKNDAYDSMIAALQRQSSAGR